MQTDQSNGDSITRTEPKDDFEAFEMALRTLSERVRTEDAFAHDLYGALCNVRWRRRDADAEPVSMSWRHAGGVVAHLACKGESYLDYYCSGNEGVVPTRIRDTLGELGVGSSSTAGGRRVSGIHRSAGGSPATAICKPSEGDGRMRADTMSVVARKETGNGRLERLSPEELAELRRPATAKSIEEKRAAVAQATQGLRVKVRVTPSMYGRR